MKINVADTARLLLKQLEAIAAQTKDKDDEIFVACAKEVTDAILARQALRSKQ